MNLIDPMEQTAPSELPPATAEPTHIGSVVQLIASILVLLVSWLLSGIMAFAGLTQALVPGGEVDIYQATSSTLVAAAFLLIGGVALGNAFYSAYRLMSKPLPEEQPLVFKILLHPVVLIVLLGLSLLFGFAVSQESSLSWWALPPAHLAAAVSGTLLVLWLAVRELNPGSPQRIWGAFISGLLIAPLFAIVLELIAVVLVLITVSLYLAANPDYTILMERLQLYLSTTSTPAPEQLLEIITPLLGDGFIIFMILLMIGFFVPLIEELIKPIGVWLSADKNLTPAQGFALGAISGGGYALFENLLITSPDSSWVMVTAARNGTSVVHILASGLIGWALVHAWREKRYLRLAGIYTISVLMHGLWNSLVVLNALNSEIALDALNEFDNFFVAPHWVNTGIIGFFMLTLVAFGTLLWLNYKLRPKFTEAASDLTPIEHE